MSSNADASTSEHWSVSRLMEVQKASWVVISLPGLLMGGVLGFGFMAALMAPPFGMFWVLSQAAQTAARTRWSPTSIGRVAGCYVATAIGIGFTVWEAAAVLVSDSSTAPVGFVMLPVFWGGVGGYAYLIAWLVGMVIDTVRA